MDLNISPRQCSALDKRIDRAYHFTPQTKEGEIQFGRLKQFLGGRQIHNDGEMQIATREWLRMQRPDLNSEGISSLTPRLDKCIGLLESLC
jgi:hypothetical protein